MTLLPTATEILARARGDLRLGLPVAVRDGTNIILVLAAEGLQGDRLAALRQIGSADLVLSGWRAETLKIQVYDGDIARIEVPQDVGMDWVLSAADPVDDLSNPLRGPFAVRRGGSARLHRLGVRLAKSAHLLPSVLAVAAPSVPEGITVLDAGPAEAALDAAPDHANVVNGRVPLSLANAGRVHVFRPVSGAEEHVVVEIGRPDRRKPVLTRLHSACFTGDVLGSLKCDCGPQLQSALQTIGAEGEGLLLYLSQEGRGIGLANKMRAYALQDQGFDTVDANHRLGFEDDERDFRIGADLLKKMGFSAVRLMTNNPAKVAMLQAQEIIVDRREPLRVGRGPENTKYLDVKAKKSGHLL